MTEDQIKKINNLRKKAEDALKSDDFILKLGGVSVYAALCDFMAIQSVRLIEQILLKGQLADENVSFQPHEDNYFYDNKVSTRKILKEIKKFLPFGPHSKSTNTSTESIKKMDIATDIYLDKSHEFLNQRNAILHHMFSQKKSYEEIEYLVIKAGLLFLEMEKLHREFMEIGGPFRFSEKEINHFYKSNSDPYASV